MDPQHPNQLQSQVEPEGPDIVDRVSKELKIELPGGKSPSVIRLIAFFTLIGGIGIIGSLLTDIIDTESKPFYIYVMRLLVGFIAIAIAYGIIELKSWSIWLYGLIVLVALFINPLVAIFPLVVVIYLVTQRSKFTPFILDFFVAWGIVKTKSIFQKKDNL